MIVRIVKVARRVTWRPVVLALVGGLAFFAIVFYSPPDARELLLGGNGLIAAPSRQLDQESERPGLRELF